MFQQTGAAITGLPCDMASSLAEILGAFSYALDLTEGQPKGHALRCCWIATQVAKAAGISGQALHDIYYAAMLKDLGCSVNAARVAEMFVGDDRRLKHAFKLIGPDQQAFADFVMREVGTEVAADTKAAAVDNLLENGGQIMTGIMGSRCTRGADIARQLRFSEDVAVAIAHLDEHWDGSGLPLGLAGDSIHIGGRLALLAQIVDVFLTAGGPQSARDEIAVRSGGWLDPDLCNIFLEISADDGFWEIVQSRELADALFAMEPALQTLYVDTDYLDDITRAFGQVIDAKSPFTGGHSARVGRYVDLVARQMGIDENSRRDLYRAAVLHDVGKLAVSSAILEKPGPLSEAEWVIMRSHSTHSFQILSRIKPMETVAVTAAAHHERLDGKGYPLGIDDSEIPLGARIITICDIYDALTADRPYRAAMSQEKAMAILHSDCNTAVDPHCLAALEVVLSARQ